MFRYALVFIEPDTELLESLCFVSLLLRLEFPCNFEPRSSLDYKEAWLLVSDPAVALPFLLEEHLLFDLARYGLGEYVVKVYIAEPLFIKDRLSYISEERRRCFVAE